MGKSVRFKKKTKTTKVDKNFPKSSKSVVVQINLDNEEQENKN